MHETDQCIKRLYLQEDNKNAINRRRDIKKLDK